MKRYLVLSVTAIVFVFPAHRSVAQGSAADTIKSFSAELAIRQDYKFATNSSGGDLVIKIGDPLLCA
jgi:hypothetical protein